MAGSSNLCGLILAAGESSRMGTDKALLPWPPRASVPAASPSQTLLSAAILALKPLTSTVIVVAGKNAEAIAPAVDSHGAFLVCNPAPERGQFSSLQVGLRELLARGCDAAIITPVDCPPLRATSLDFLRASFERARARGLWAVAPENNGKHGHPLLVCRELVDVFLAAPVTSTAREVLHAHAQHIQYIPVPDALVKAGLNTPEDYAALAAKTTPPAV
jgi:molybdenum cofactor cytidylyltransferase